MSGKGLGECRFAAPRWSGSAPRHTQRTATSRRRERWAEGWHVSITGDVGTYVGPEAMGIDWMTGNELCEAVPPAYTRFIGKQIYPVAAANAAAREGRRAA